MATHNCTCATCGAQFKPVKGKANIYCGLPCYWEALRAGKYNRGTSRRDSCHHCGKDVLGRSKSKKRNGERSDKLFCDRNCYDSYRAAKHQAVIGECSHCGAEMIRGAGGSARRKFCDAQCRFLGLKPKPRNCMQCGSLFTPLKYMVARRQFVANKGARFCSDGCYDTYLRTNEERKQRISEAFSGPDHPNWQGGPSFGNRSSRGAGWQRQRERAIQRDQCRCVGCGITREAHKAKYGCDLNVNHIRPFWQFGGRTQAANALSNLETLCKACHTKKDWEYRKQNPIQMVIGFG